MVMCGTYVFVLCIGKFWDDISEWLWVGETKLSNSWSE